MLPMSEAPRDGTVIVAWHKVSHEPMAVRISAAQERVVGVVDYRGTWSYFPSGDQENARGDLNGYVREEHLAGWVPLPAFPHAKP